MLIPVIYLKNMPCHGKLDNVLKVPGTEGSSMSKKTVSQHVTPQSLLKCYFRIREIIRQGGLPERGTDHLWRSLRSVIIAIARIQPRNAEDISTKLRLVRDLVEDWQSDPHLTVGVIALTHRQAANIIHQDRESAS